jgi:hypothetical protein
MVKKRSKNMKPKTASTVKNTEIMSARELMITFVVWMLGHSAVLFLANRFFPEAVVLGTHQFSIFQSIFYSMMVFTLITVGSIPIIEYVAVLQNRVLKTMDWMVSFFFINALGIWLVARFAEQLGLGISSWVVAAILALVFDVVQGLLVTKVIR